MQNNNKNMGYRYDLLYIFIPGVYFLNKIDFFPASKYFIFSPLVFFPQEGEGGMFSVLFILFIFLTQIYFSFLSTQGGEKVEKMFSVGTVYFFIFPSHTCFFLFPPSSPHAEYTPLLCTFHIGKNIKEFLV